MKGLMALLSLVLLAGCFSLTDKQAPVVQLPSHAAAPVRQAQQSNQSRPTFTIPDTLGGLVSSDSWTVYQDTQEEELTGHVSYDNGVVIFRADYARSQRAKHLLTARGAVYVRKNEPDGSWYEVYADEIVYNYQTGQGRAKASGKELLKLIYRNPQGETLTARARQATFHTQQETYQLDGQAVVTHLDAQGQRTVLHADQISARQADSYARLKGHARADYQTYVLQADEMEYDGQTRQARAMGGRPLTQGTAEGNTFAIIADEVTADTAGQTIYLDGQVQGWVVSPQLDQSGANKTF